MKPDFSIPIHIIEKEEANDKARLIKRNRVCYIGRQIFSTTVVEEAKNKRNEKNILWKNNKIYKILFNIYYCSKFNKSY